MTENITFGLVVTRLGFNLLAKWGAGASRTIEDIWVGSGMVTEGMSLMELTGLIQPVAQATSTVPQTIDNQVHLIVQYRNEMSSSLPGFWLSEYGIFATDPEVGRIMLIYGALQYPEWVAPYSSGILNTRNYPVTFGVSGNGEIVLNFPANAFVSAEAMANFFYNAIAALALERVEFSDAPIPAMGTRTHHHIIRDVPTWSPAQPFGMEV